MYQYLNNALNSMPWLSGFLAACGLLTLVIFLARLSSQYQPGGRLDTLACWLRQQGRRWSWAYLFAIGLLSYPYQLLWLVRWDVGGLPTADERLHAATLANAKLVDPLLFYSKVSISLGVFCLVNFLAFTALRVIPVLIDWATGYYREPQGDFPARPGFKGTFLRELSHAQRMAVYLAVWGLELVIGWGSAHAGFSIQ